MTTFGHKEKLKIFRRLVEKESLAHAYLFFGPKSVGKFTVAHELAHALEHGVWEVTSRPLIDTLITGQNTNPIAIDETRAIKHFLSQSSFTSKKRTVIIDNAETITWQAAPALLKIVEEPPRHALIIFIASEQSVLIPALRSRCTKIYFKNLPRNVIEKVLTEQYDTAPAHAQKIAAASFGRIGLALQKISPERSRDEVEGQQKTKPDDPPLVKEIAQKIKTLYLENPQKNAHKISFLLKKEEVAARFNLNPKIQRKAIHTVL